jgi:MFS family permease
MPHFPTPICLPRYSLLAIESLRHPAFLTLCVCSFLFFSSYHITIPLFPLFCKSLHLDNGTIGQLVALLIGTSLLMRLWVGQLADKVLPTHLMLAGVAFFLLGSLGFLWVTPQTPWLCMAPLRVIQGIGFSLFYTASSSFLASLLPLHRRSEGISHHSNSIKLANAFAPMLGLYAAASLGFSNGFMMAAGVSVLAMVAVAWLAMGVNTTRPLLKPMSATDIAHHDAKPHPLFNKKVLFPGVIMATNSLVFGALIPFAPLLCHDKALEQPQWFYLVYAFALIASRSFTAKWADTYGHHVVIVPGMILVALSLLGMTMSGSIVVFLLCAGLYGLGAGVVQPALIAMAVDRTEAHERGSAMATFTLFTDLGHALGSLMMGFISQWYSYDLGLLAVMLLTLLGLLGYTWGWLKTEQTTSLNLLQRFGVRR